MAKHAHIMAAAPLSATATHSPDAIERLRAAVAGLALACRPQLELIVQASIEMLDELDGDPDLEPTLGAPDRHPGNGPYNRANPCQTDWAQGSHGDREEECEDEGAQCEDDGVDTDSEPDETVGNSNLGCHWQDEGDQTHLVPHRVFIKRRPKVNSRLQNVGEFIPVRSL